MKRKVKASYTIEAAFILPMIFTIIVLIIYWMFFFHDRAVLSSSAYSAALKGSLAICDNDKENIISRESEKLIKNRLIATKNVETQIDIKGNEIMVKYKGQLKIPVGTLFFSLVSSDKSVIEVNAQGKANIIDAVKFIKECRFIENAAVSLKRG